MLSPVYYDPKYLVPPSYKTDKFLIYADDPVGFIDSLGYSLTEEQIQIATHVNYNKETNVQAAHAVGKSFLASLLLVWWVLCKRGLCISTAPTARQVKNILWAEVKSVIHRNGLPDEGLAKMQYDVDDEARAFGFTAADRNSNAFQGVHARNLLVILDESCGISQEIDDGAVSCATGSANRLLRIGNPIVPNNPFHTACIKNNIKIPVWNHPNVSWAYVEDSRGIPVLRPEVAAAVLNDQGDVIEQVLWPEEFPRDDIEGAISLSYIEAARRRGVNSPFWKSRIEAEFPSDVSCAIIPESYWKAARDRYDSDPDYWQQRSASLFRRSYGLDPGDVSDDHGYARWSGPVLDWGHLDPVQGDRLDVHRCVQYVQSMVRKDHDKLFIDSIGIGSGSLAEGVRLGLPCVGVKWSEAAKRSAQFLNSKAEQFWRLRTYFIEGSIAIAPFEDPEVEKEAIRQFSNYYFEETSNFKIKIEDKKNTMQRLGCSPNLADAIVLASNGISFYTKNMSGILKTPSVDKDTSAARQRGHTQRRSKALSKRLAKRTAL